MSGARRDAKEPRRARWLAAALTVTAVALAGCGADEEAGVKDAKSDQPSKSAAAAEADPILIKTRVDLPTGEVVDGSTIGDSPFCPGGTFMDQHGTAEIGFVDRTITCQDGTLRMGFDPQVPEGNTQGGPWRIISGTGAYKGWEGRGQMVMRYDPSDKSPHPSRGQERYRGTVTHQQSG